MKKEILLIATRGSSGKTTTINLLYEKFIKFYNLEDKKPVSRRDFRVFHKEDCLNGHCVGFASEGDCPNTVKENCDFFLENNCTICITACRTRGETKKKILKFAEDNSMKISCFNNLNDNVKFEATNGEKARMMLNRLKYLINPK